MLRAHVFRCQAPASETSLLDRLAEENIIGSDSHRRSIPAPVPAPAPQQTAGQIGELTRQLNDALAQKQALENELAALQAAAASRPAHDASEGGSDAAGKEIIGLNQQVAELLAQNQILAQQREDQERMLADLRKANQQAGNKPASQQAGDAKGEIPGPARRVAIDSTAPKDVRISYALGAWYGDSAPQETQKLQSIGRKLDLPAFAQGSTTGSPTACNCPRTRFPPILPAWTSSWMPPCCPRMKSRARSCWRRPQKKKRRRQDAGRAVYRILKKGTPPMVTAQNEILFELEEKLSSGEVLSTKEGVTSKVTDLPPAFKAAVTQLGLGGSAKIHVPAKLIEGDSGSEDIPPGASLIMTINIVGIK